VIYFVKVARSEVLKNRLALKARLDAEYLSKSKISFGEDFIDIAFKDSPYKGLLLHIKKKSDGSYFLILHSFNIIVLIGLFIWFLLILFTDFILELAYSYDAILNPKYYLFGILFSSIISFYWKAYRLIKTLRLNA